MTRLKPLIGTLAAVAALGSLTAAAQDYPTRPVRLIVPFAAGGPTDVIARVVAQKLTEGLGHQVVVDNRAGAGGNIGMGLAAGAPADGHTLIMVSSSFVVNPGLYKSIPYDPYKSFVPISNVAASPPWSVLRVVDFGCRCPPSTSRPRDPPWLRPSCSTSPRPCRGGASATRR